MKKLFILLLASVPVFGYGQENTSTSFSLGAVAELPGFAEKMKMPWAAEIAYGNARYFGTMVFGYGMNNKSYASNYRTLEHNEDLFRFSLMGGACLGSHRRFEFSAGGTVLLGKFSTRDMSMFSYSANIKGNRQLYYVSANMGYRYTFGSGFFIKPELSFNYEVGSTTRYTLYEMDVFNLTVMENHSVNFLSRFLPVLRIGVGYTFGK